MWVYPSDEVRTSPEPTALLPQLPAAAGVLHVDSLLLPVQLHLGDEAVGTGQEAGGADSGVAHGEITSWAWFAGSLYYTGPAAVPQGENFLPFPARLWHNGITDRGRPGSARRNCHAHPRGAHQPGGAGSV